jgi:hypothetical protein
MAYQGRNHYGVLPYLGPKTAPIFRGRRPQKVPPYFLELALARFPARFVPQNSPTNTVSWSKVPERLILGTFSRAKKTHQGRLILKQQWTVTELIETFTLTSEELALMTGITAHNRLGFAVLLKFFQQEARFPKQPAEVPQTIIDYLAKRLNVPPVAYQQGNWQGRSINDHRSHMRQWFGFRPYTAADRETLRTWLCDTALAQNQKKGALA